MIRTVQNGILEHSIFTRIVLDFRMYVTSGFHCRIIKISSLEDCGLFFLLCWVELL